MYYINFKAINLILKSPIGIQKRDVLLYLVRESISNKKYRLEFLERLYDRLIDYLTLINKGLFIEIDGESRYEKEVFTDWESATNSFNSRLCEAVRDNKDNPTYNKNWVRITYHDESIRFRYDLNHTYNIINCLKKFMIEDINRDIKYLDENGDPLDEISYLTSSKAFLNYIPE
jgi:hypothetical protein